MFHRAKSTKYLSTLSFIAACLTFIVIGLGAFTRLSNAGLGCPDWPGCYGHLIASQQSAAQPINLYKAQVEMVHRYFAGTLGAFVIVIALLCAITSRYFLSISLFALIVYQVLLGMWTVTLKLSPAIVMQHLLAGMTILSLLWLIYLNTRSRVIENVNTAFTKTFRTFALFGLILLFLQIVLGAWTSSHYAGLLYDGLSAAHRWGGVIVGCVLFSLFLSIQIQYQTHLHLRKISWYLLFFLGVQICLGLINILFQLPLWIAIAHNLTAATLLLIMVTINYLLV